MVLQGLNAFDSFPGTMMDPFCYASSHGFWVWPPLVYDNVHSCLKGNLEALLDCHLLDLGDLLIVAMLLDIISLGLDKAALEANCGDIHLQELEGHPRLSLWSV